MPPETGQSHGRDRCCRSRRTSARTRPADRARSAAPSWCCSMTTVLRKAQLAPSHEPLMSRASSASSSDASGVCSPSVRATKLVDRRAGLHALGRLAPWHAGQESCRRCRVGGLAAAFRCPFSPEHDDQAIADRRQRLQNRRAARSRLPRSLGVQLLHRHAVGHVDDAESPHRLAGGVRRRCQRRHHRVEQRKRDG